VIELNLHGLWTKSCLMLNRLKFHQIIHDTTTSMHQQVPCTRKNDILGSWWLIVCCKLAPTLVRQMWRRNDVISRNEYLISTLSESTVPWVYSLQFLFKSTYYYWRYERKCEWVFFFLNTVYSNHQASYQPLSWCNPSEAHMNQNITTIITCLLFIYLTD